MTVTHLIYDLHIDCSMFRVFVLQYYSSRVQSFSENIPKFVDVKRYPEGGVLNDLINTTKLSHRFHTVKPIHFLFFPSKFTRLNQCVRWQFRNHEVFLIYTRFLRGKIVFSTNNIFCVSKQYCFEKLLCFREKTQNSDFFQKLFRRNVSF